MLLVVLLDSQGVDDKGKEQRKGTEENNSQRAMPAYDRKRTVGVPELN
jgi:hypothetical protein